MPGSSTKTDRVSWRIAVATHHQIADLAKKHGTSEAAEANRLLAAALIAEQETGIASPAEAGLLATQLAAISAQLQGVQKTVEASTIATNDAVRKAIADAPAPALQAGPTEGEVQARIDAAVTAERKRIRSLPVMDRLRRRF